MNQAVAEKPEKFKRPAGRPKIHDSARERYKAFRTKKSAQGMHEVRMWLPASAAGAVAAARALLAAALTEEKAQKAGKVAGAGCVGGLPVKTGTGERRCGALFLGSLVVRGY